MSTKYKVWFLNGDLMLNIDPSTEDYCEHVSALHTPHSTVVACNYGIRRFPQHLEVETKSLTHLTKASVLLSRPVGASVEDMAVVLKLSAAAVREILSDIITLGGSVTVLGYDKAKQPIFKLVQPKRAALWSRGKHIK